MNKQELKDKIFDKAWEENRAEYLIKLEDLFEILDDYEILSQKWIEEKRSKARNVDGHIDVIPTRGLQNLLVPKQQSSTKLNDGEVKLIVGIDGGTDEYHDMVIDEAIETLTDYESKYAVVVRPTIPSFVADFVTWTKDWTLSEIFDEEGLYEVYDDVAKWLYDNDKDINQERELMLVTARSRGYENEEESKFYVLDREDVPLLANFGYGVFRTHTELSIHEKGRSNEPFALTDKEIEDFDPRFWAFAVPVEEVD